MKIICIGRNYADHARELNNDVPEEPVFFLKPDSALVIRNRPFFYPGFSSEVHHELEVVLRIGRLGRSIDEKFASRYYDRIGLGVDFTARDLQAKVKKRGMPWEIAKGFDYSAPISDLLPVEEFGAMDNLGFRLDRNGATVQEGNTGDLVFSFEQIIAYVSRFMTLKTGDLIFTGTPAGVGPVAIGDRLEAWLEGKKMMDFQVK